MESVGPKSMLNTERVRADLLSPLENLSVGNSLLSTDVAFGHDVEGLYSSSINSLSVLRVISSPS